MDVVFLWILDDLFNLLTVYVGTATGAGPKVD